VVWKAQPSVNGFAKVEKTKAGVELNLRLPGQYFDAESRLHDNFHRTYNPSTGRYLQADPLGYPDGPDSYLYASGDPVNRVDPLGLYEEDVHYYMTFALARLAGLSAKKANTIASAAQFVDDNDFTRPLYLVEPKFHVDRLAKYHFTQSGFDPVQGGMTKAAYQDARVKNPANPQITNLLNAANYGIGNPYVKEHDQCLRAQLFGEYLHALEDTFGHRDALNAPVDLNGGLGHLLYGTETDKTYDGYVNTSSWPLANGDWGKRESRTLEMEKTVFKKLQENFGLAAKDQNGFPITFADFENEMKAFNATKEDEAIKDSNNRTFLLKKQLLVNLLTKFGLGDLPTYNVKSACENRKAYLNSLKDKNGLLPDNFYYAGALKLPGTILGTTETCPATRPS
jgi:RHS repeat-associated protein